MDDDFTNFTKSIYKQIRLKPLNWGFSGYKCNIITYLISFSSLGELYDKVVNGD